MKDILTIVIDDGFTIGANCTKLYTFIQIRPKQYLNTDLFKNGLRIQIRIRIQKHRIQHCSKTKWVDNMPFPKRNQFYMYSFTLWICVMNTALYSLKKLDFKSKSKRTYSNLILLLQFNWILELDPEVTFFRVLTSIMVMAAIGMLPPVFHNISTGTIAAIGMLPPVFHNISTGTLDYYSSHWDATACLS